VPFAVFLRCLAYTDGLRVYRQFKFSVKNWSMDVIAAARALNQKAVRQNWHHFCDPTLAFVDPGYEKLLTLWRTKAGDRRMPSRSDITPRDIKDILRNILLLEKTSDNPVQYRWRLIGTALTSILGENTGKTFEESIPAEHLTRWMDCADLILKGGQPLRFLGRVHASGREYLDAENLFVPLANDNGEPTFILGQCRYTPRRSETEDIWENQMASLPGGLL
jgi:hypothetical protein